MGKNEIGKWLIVHDHTSEPLQTLFRLHPHPRINSDAWKMAADEAINHCHMSGTGPVPPKNSTDDIPGIPEQPTEDTITYIRNLVRTIVDRSEIQARTSLQVLETKACMKLLAVDFLDSPGQFEVALR